MKFDEIIDVAATWIEGTYDTQGYEYDLYDSLYPLGTVVDTYKDQPMRNHKAYSKSMINYQVTLNDSFSSFQHVNRVALTMIQECYYQILGAHFVTHDEKSLTIRFVTVSTWCYITGTIEIIGPHYEKLYKEYQDFLGRS
jgi:hypothetical protein